MGHAVSSELMVGHAHMDCGMGDMDKSCENPNDEQNHINPTPCCENIYQTLEVEDTFTLQQTHKTPTLDFVAAFVLTYNHTFHLNKTNTPHFPYTSPLVTRNLPVLHQMFLL